MTEQEKLELEEKERLAKEQQGAKDPTVQDLLDQMKKLKLETVSKEEYERVAASNKQLVNEIANNRPVPNAEKKDVRKIKLDAIQERTKKIGQGTSLDNVKILVDNYKDMKELGFDVSNVDEDVVGKLDAIITEAKGDSGMFNALMESRVKIK
jgi:hypothetical protein